MELLVDLFGYLTIVMHGLTILAQCMALGGVAFLVLLLRPLAPRLAGIDGPITERVIRIASWSAAALVLTEIATLAMNTAVLVDTVGITLADALSAHYAVASLVKLTASVALALTLMLGGSRAPSSVLLALGLLELAAATMTTHAAARLSDRGILILATFVHQLGAAIWIGGIPSFLAALARTAEGGYRLLIGRRFSRISTAGVACIVASIGVLAVFYIGDTQGLYGTAYGVMAGAKGVLFLMLLGLGAGNYLLIERLAAAPATSINRLRRFAEVELGIGIAIFCAAASLTSVPPAVDLSADRVTWAEIVDRNTPTWPRLRSPDHDTLALPALQARLDTEATANRDKPPVAFVPGAGDLPPRNAADIAWSEYNHHWAGLFVVLLGVLALLNQAGQRWARHWPLVFLGLAVFLFFRSDPEAWPLGQIGFLESLRDVEVLQHRTVVLLLVAFAWFEWRVRATGWRGQSAALVFPLLCAGGGILLLTHSHAIANVKDQLLIEITHTPLAIAGVAAGWARWLELRLDPGENPLAHRVAGWLWPICLILCGLILLVYREA